MKLLKYFIIIFIILVPIAVYADNSRMLGPPNEIIIGIILLILILGIGGSFLISRLVKYLIENIRNEERKHIWYQITLGFLMAIIFLIAQENWYWLKHTLTSMYNGEFLRDSIILFSFSFFSILVGSIIGYFITPVVNKKATNMI